MLSQQQQVFLKVLDLVEEAGCTRYVVLIGSWAEFVYRESGMLKDFAPNIKTLDVDFLVRNLRHPTPPANLASLARERGFLVESDVLNGTTKFMDLSGLEVEFLIGKMGAGIEAALKTNVGVTAQALRHLDVLSHNAVKTFYLGRAVSVPTPEAYTVHKMVINNQRGAKAEKDANSVLGLWPYLNMAALNGIIEGLSKKERARVRQFMNDHGLQEASDLKAIF